ncbi:MAG: hypothetical protein JWQ07_4868, partial [Ramlibacter sp.]|nr:hypothetical protein [Ramlibacter sp.]
MTSVEPSENVIRTVLRDHGRLK